MKKLLSIILILFSVVLNAQTPNKTINTNMVVNSGVELSKTYGVRLLDTTTVYNDLMFPFSTGHQGNANYPPFIADSLYFAFGIDSVGVDAQFMYFVIQLPHNYKEGTKIYPHVHYKYETAVGTATFKMKYKWYNIGETTQVGWKWYTMGSTTGTTDKTHVMAYGTGGIDGTNKGISSILVCIVYLTGATGTPPVNAWQFDCHIEIDSMGSRGETQK